MFPDECKELETSTNKICDEPENSFTQEVVKEALGDLYTEHVKITLKSPNSNSDNSIVMKSDSINGKSVKASDMKTFKHTYFGATQKSQRFDESVLKSIEIMETQGRTHFDIFFLFFQEISYLLSFADMQYLST